MPGRGDGLRGADREAEDMAVPSAISEKPLLRVPPDDLLKSGRTIAPKRWIKFKANERIKEAKDDRVKRHGALSLSLSRSVCLSVSSWAKRNDYLDGNAIRIRHMHTH